MQQTSKRDKLQKRSAREQRTNIKCDRRALCLGRWLINVTITVTRLKRRRKIRAVKV